ncbi:unnamed protein product [Lathyrus oleraceus]
MCPPLVKYKPKRVFKNSKKGKEGDMHNDPSRWEYGEGSQGSHIIKRSCTKPTRSQPSDMSGKVQSSTASSRHLYLSQFPDFLYPYINDIIDIGDDGTCGFQAIVTLLGRGEESWPLIQTQLDTQVHQHP